MNELRKKLGIDEWLDLVKEDKNLDGAYISFAQYMYSLEQENDYWEQTHDYDIRMIDRVKGNSIELFRENRQLEERIKQKDEVIDEAINLNCEVIKMINEGYSREQYSGYIKKALDILQKYKGDNNE